MLDLLGHLGVDRRDDKDVLALRMRMRALATWSLPRWEPDDPQTEGEQMRLYAMRAMGIEAK